MRDARHFRALLVIVFPIAIVVVIVVLGLMTGAADGGRSVAGPALPTVVGVSVFSRQTQWSDIYRVWSDGRIDFVRQSMNVGQTCDPIAPCVLVPGACEAADINRDGETGIVDFLAVLDAWGPCP